MRNSLANFIAVAFVVLLMHTGAARAVNHIIKVRIDTATAVGKIPDDFLGFGYETSAVAQPGFFSAKNSRMIRLYRNLSPHGLIRVGGNVSDHTRFVPDGTPAAKTEREVTIINRQNLADLGDFARASGWRVMWGLNLGTGSREEAVAEAQAVSDALGPSLQSFEIGNEVDLMRKFGKNFDAYHTAYLDYKSAIRAELPRAEFSGPDVAGSYSYVEKFVSVESSDIALVTHHYYRGGARDPKSTLQRLLTRDANFDSRLQQLHALCRAHHLDYRINETNSYSGGGKEGVSDTFGSALWCLDYLFDLASNGCSGVNMETDINQLGFISFYSPIVHDAAVVCSAQPEYYAMLTFAMSGHGQLLATHVEKDQINVTCYATDAAGAIDLTIINKDLAGDAVVECALPEGMHKVDAFRLTAPAVGAKLGVTFAGSAVSDDGSWTPAAGEPVPLSGRDVRIPVPHSSAVVLKFNRE